MSSSSKPSLSILLLFLVLFLTISLSTCSPTLSNDQIDEIASLSHEMPLIYHPEDIILNPMRTNTIPRHLIGQNAEYPHHDVKMVSDVDRIEAYGEYLYEGIVVLLPQTERLSGPVKPKALLEFVDSGRHLLIAAASDAVSDALREISSESALEFDHDKSRLHDYFHVAGNDGEVFTSQVNEKVIREGMEHPVVYKGMAMMETTTNPLIIPILRGEKTSFSNVVGDSLDEAPNCAGEECLLVAAIQGRNGARLTFVAGTDMLSDAFFDMQVQGAQSGNRGFSHQLLLWSLGLRGVLRFRNVQSHAEGDKVGKQMFTIFEHVYYSVIIEEYDGEKKQWVPYVANDIQLEFIMLDPYYRIPLKYNPDLHLYEARLQIPDKYGVFKFSVDYRRAGYTPLVFETRQTVRPFRLDQYERFIPAAYPYYMSMFSLMIGFVFVSALALYAGYDGRKLTVAAEKVKKTQ